MDIKRALNKIASREDLTGEEMRQVMTTIMNGEPPQYRSCAKRWCRSLPRST
jgi:anthranilate phosphoribosyltransferase